MIADFFTKPLQGTLFDQMREKVTGISSVWAAIKFIYKIYKKFILTVLCLIFTLNLSSQNNFIFTHNFYNITVCEYLSYFTSPSLSFHEYNVGVC